MRKLVCWACGRPITTGKFLHCTACGVNFGEECFHYLKASMVQEGAIRPDNDAPESPKNPEVQFDNWTDLGNMMGKDVFVAYFLTLVKIYEEEGPTKPFEFKFQCLSCHVDVDYQLGDAKLFSRLQNVMKNKEREFTLTGVEIVQAQNIPFIDSLDITLQTRFHEIVKSGLPDQLKIMNQVLGANWQIKNQDIDPDSLGFDKTAADLTLMNEI